MNRTRKNNGARTIPGISITLLVVALVAMALLVAACLAGAYAPRPPDFEVQTLGIFGAGVLLALPGTSTRASSGEVCQAPWGFFLRISVTWPSPLMSS